MNVRVGFGYDIHVLQEGVPFSLGGIVIPHDKGAAGHSDGDVLIHAICDALLGACSLGDIGRHFPDTDPQYKGIDSKKLLAAVVAKVTQAGGRIGNVDCTVVLEKPKIAAHSDAMRNVLAGVLGIAASDVSVKATTHEKLGPVGREEGVCAYAVALVYK